MKYPSWYAWQETAARVRERVRLSGAGAVRVRPVGLTQRPARKR
ncbi:hypothetical protein SGRIM128S_07683 [Streptomyces griseomycini]